MNVKQITIEVSWFSIIYKYIYLFRVSPGFHEFATTDNHYYDVFKDILRPYDDLSLLNALTHASQFGPLYRHDS